MDWSLLGCGAKGHITYAPTEPALRGRLSVTLPGAAAGGTAPGQTALGEPVPESTAWRCLRCGSFVSGPPAASGPAADAPQVRRGKELRSALILRLFAVERFARALVFGVLAYGIWRFSVSRLSVEAAFDRELPLVRDLMRNLGFNVSHSKLLGLIQDAFTLNARTLALLTAAAAAYAVVEIVEGVGLWLLKRWGEYFAMVATSAGLPYEVYDLTAKVTVLRVLAFAVNLALVVYLVVTKRLFGVRGGREAYEARQRSESIIDTEVAALAASPAQSAGPAQPAGSGRHTGSGWPGEPARPAGPGNPAEPRAPGSQATAAGVPGPAPAGTAGAPARPGQEAPARSPRDRAGPGER